MRALPSFAFAVAVSFVARGAWAVDADPSNYEAIVPTLTAGDTLNLAAGTYTGNLDLVGLAGTEASPITIAGPADGSAVFVGNSCCNTVELVDSSYVVIKNLTVDGQGLDGVFGVSAKGATNVVHHITIEGCRFIGQGASQQTVAISTKSPTWGWVIRRNRIEGAGTGLYLGNSDGSQPFVAGVIENNLVMDTVGYNMQIKFQNAWPAGAGLPTEPSSTLIRDNVFIKNDGPSPDGDRPNVLVGGFPESGPGSENQVEVYGNLFFHNPREAHLQASGRVSVHDNLFVDAVDAAIVVTDHDLPLRRARIYNNTIYGAARGVRFANAAPEGDFVRGNLIFAPEGVTGPAADLADNLVLPMADAATVVNAPSLILGQMDFFPLTGQAQGAPIDLSAVATDVDYAVDFNRTSKGDFTFRGAYAGEGQNPGWHLAAELKDVTSTGPQGGGGAGAGGGAAGSGAANSAGGGDAAGGGSAANGDGDGCDCRAGRGRPGDAGHLWMAGIAVAVWSRRRISLVGPGRRA